MARTVTDQQMADIFMEYVFAWVNKYNEEHPGTNPTTRPFATVLADFSAKHAKYISETPNLLGLGL